jgi:isopenicillin N synthase-like dioxygenase
MAAASQQASLSTPPSLFSYNNGIPFPSDIETAPLVTLSLSKLSANDHEEQGRLYEAGKTLGFFYLDLRGCRQGETLLQDADRLFEINKAFFGLPVEVKQQFDFACQGSYFGYKGMGAEVVDGKGTKDRNEIYNVCSE